MPRETAQAEAIYVPSSSFTPHPEGDFPAICCDVIQGERLSTYTGKMAPTLRLVFQTNHLLENGSRATCSRTFGLTLNEKSALRPFVEDWLNRQLTREELAHFNAATLLGQPAQLRIRHEVGKDGSAFARIKRIEPPLPSGHRLTVEGYTRVKDRQDAGPTGDRPPFRAASHGTGNPVFARPPAMEEPPPPDTPPGDEDEWPV